MPGIRALVIVMSLAVAATATNIPDPAISFYEIDSAAVGASIFVVPDGSGVPLTEAFQPGGTEVDATITATLLDYYGNPIVGYPHEDVWLMTADDGLVACPGGTNPDGPSDVNGQVFWQAPLRAGGMSDVEAVHVYVAGTPLYGAPLELRFNSADINGDLAVDLTDIVLFAQVLSGYDYVVDFNYDGTVNLSDIARFVPVLGAVCD